MCVRVVLNKLAVALTAAWLVVLALGAPLRAQEMMNVEPLTIVTSQVAKTFSAEIADTDVLLERGLVHTLPHPHLGSVAMVRPAQGLAAQLIADFTAPPMLGQDTASVLTDILGYSPETIDQLIGTGAIGVYAPAAEPVSA